MEQTQLSSTAAQVVAWFEGHAAAAGSGGFCWRSQERSAPSLSRVLCCRLCLTRLTFAENPAVIQAWTEVAQHQHLSAGPAGLAGAAQKEHLLLLQNAAATAELLLGWLLSAAGYMYVFGCVYIYVVSECAPTRRLPPVSPSLAGLRGVAGKEGPAVQFLLSPLAAAQMEACLEGLLLRLASGLAGPTGCLKNALLRRRPGCYVADCA